MLTFSWRLVKLDTYIRFDTDVNPAVTAGHAAITFALFIVSCLSYTATVYPNISVNFGGGNYTKGPNAVICMSGTVVPAEIMTSGACTVPVKIIHETDTMIYVAPSFGFPNGNYSTNSIRPALERSLDWQSWTNMPRIYGIAVRSIASESDASWEVNERTIAQPPVKFYTDSSSLLSSKHGERGK
jgi:hypothetical protein